MNEVSRERCRDRKTERLLLRVACALVHLPPGSGQRVKIKENVDTCGGKQAPAQAPLCAVGCSVALGAKMAAAFPACGPPPWLVGLGGCVLRGPRTPPPTAARHLPSLRSLCWRIF